jgi:hypothetical protein
VISYGKSDAEIDGFRPPFETVAKPCPRNQAQPSRNHCETAVKPPETILKPQGETALPSPYRGRCMVSRAGMGLAETFPANGEGFSFIKSRSCFVTGFSAPGTGPGPSPTPPPRLFSPTARLPTTAADLGADFSGRLCRRAPSPSGVAKAARCRGCPQLAEDISANYA